MFDVYKQVVKSQAEIEQILQAHVCSSDPSGACIEMHSLHTEQERSFNQLLGHAPNYQNSMFHDFTTHFGQQKGTSNSFCKISAIYIAMKTCLKSSLQTMLIWR